MMPVMCVGIVFSGLVVYTMLEGKRVYQQELEKALTKSVSYTLEEVMRKEAFGYEQKNEFIATFMQEFIRQSNSEVDMTVRVISADPVKGLLDVEVCEKPLFMGIWQENIVVRKTVVFEKEQRIS